jgi:hypothetical protein
VSNGEPERPPPDGRWEQPTASEPQTAPTTPLGPPTPPAQQTGWQQPPIAPPPPPPQPPYSWGPPPAWGYTPPPYYGYAPPQPQTEGMAIVVLVLAVASFFMFGVGVVMAIVALCLCPSARRKIEDSNGTLTGEGMVTAARIIPWVNVGLVALMAVAFIVIIILATIFSEDEYTVVLSLA